MKPLFTIITPSRGDRPRGLAQAIQSAKAAVDRFASLSGSGRIEDDIAEMLVGFDGVKDTRGPDPEGPSWLRCFDFPQSGDYGNAIRNGLLKAAQGEAILFLDDDNALTENALLAHWRCWDAELIIGRVDTSRAFDIPFLPRDDEGETVRQGNIDPLCLCVKTDLAWNRGRGWSSEGGYESDFLNIRRYHRRARSVAETSEVVGIYDAGLGLDDQGANPRQQRLLALDVTPRTR